MSQNSNLTQTKFYLRNMVANVKINTLWCGYRLNVFNDKLKPFFKVLEDNNDLLLLFKSAERQNSIYGSSFLYFDVDYIDSTNRDTFKDIKVGLYAYNQANQTMKKEGLKEFASVGVRIITRNKTGLEIAIKECRTKGQVQKIPYSGGTSNRKYLTIDTFTIKNPESVNKLAKVETIQLPYGVLSAKQFLNKNIVDFEYNEVILPDWAPVEDFERQIHETLNYIDSERMTNKTRVYGTFSNQDIIAREKPSMIENTLHNLSRSGLVDNTVVKNYYENLYDSASILKNSMFVNTVGSANKVEVQVGSLDQEKLTKGLTSLLEIYFNGCGLDYALKNNVSGAVKSIDEVKSQSKTTYETIKSANVLRKAQIEEFIERIMIACGINPMEYRGQWSFDIVSNILNEEDNNKDVIINMRREGLLSSNEAIKRANPNMNDKDVETMIGEIKEESPNAIDLIQGFEKTK